MFIINDLNDNSYIAHKYETLPNANHFYKHTHNHCEIFLFVDGNASFNIEGNIFKLSPYDIVLIPPQHYHCLILDEFSTYERFVFEFPVDKYPAVDIAEVFKKAKVFNISDNTRLMSVFLRLKEYRNIFDDISFEKVAHLLVQECIMLLKITVSDPVEYSYNPLTKKILKYINNNIEKPLTVADLSNEFYLSKSHIQNVFFENMKIGIKSYILQKKMIRAKELLESGNLPVEVSEKLGYIDYTTFYRNFKKIYKFAPKHYFHTNNE